MLNFPYPLNIMFPGAAGNWQAFDARFLSPNVSVNFAGDPTVEREVTEDVASFGTQIGWLNDIVSALAAAAGDSLEPKANDALTKLTKPWKTSKRSSSAARPTSMTRRATRSRIWPNRTSPAIVGWSARSTPKIRRAFFKQ